MPGPEFSIPCPSRQETVDQIVDLLFEEKMLALAPNGRRKLRGVTPVRAHRDPAAHTGLLERDQPTRSAMHQIRLNL
jgi:hypothetical protein